MQWLKSNAKLKLNFEVLKVKKKKALEKSIKHQMATIFFKQLRVMEKATIKKICIIKKKYIKRSHPHKSILIVTGFHLR